MRFATASLLAATLSTTALAEPTALSAPDVIALLSGNTAIGLWGDSAYRQYFSENGVTFYAVQGRRTDRGNWRVNTDTHAYESQWRGGSWDPYDVLIENGTYFWKGGGQLYEFTVVPGQQLDWPAD